MAGVLDGVNQRTQLAGHNRMELLLFRLTGKQRYGINIFKVQEVIQCPRLTFLPNAASVVCGISNIRGKTISIIDLGAAVGLQPLEQFAGCFVIITEYNRTIDGKNAWDTLQKIAVAPEPVAQQIGMIICDIEMPNMDDYTFTSLVKQDPRFKDLFIMLHTSLSGVFNQAMVNKVGANAFVPKFEPDELVAVVMQQFSGLEAGIPMRHQGAA